MASTFCNLISIGSGQKKLGHYLLNQNNNTRHCRKVPSSYVVQRSSFCHHKTESCLNRTHKGRLTKRRRQCRCTSFKNGEEHLQSTSEVKTEEYISRATLIWRAIKLPIYSVALVPLTVGSAAAYLQTGLYSARRYFVLLASSVLVIAWLNLRYDQKRVSCKYGWQPYGNSTCCLYVTCSGFCWTGLGFYGGWKCAFNVITGLCNHLWLYISGTKHPCWSWLIDDMLGMLKIYITRSFLHLSYANITAYPCPCTLMVLCNNPLPLCSFQETFIIQNGYTADLCWLYYGANPSLTILARSISRKLDSSPYISNGTDWICTCPPFRLSYQGFGEPLCFAAFGPFATTAFYLLQSNASELPITGTILSASLLVGLTTALILFCSHFHQVKGDRAVGKMSPLVRLGTEAGSTVVKVGVVTLYSLLLILGLSRALPFACMFLCSLTLPVGKLVVSFVEENHKDTTKIFMAKYYCVRLHALFGAALAAGLVASRIIVERSL